MKNEFLKMKLKEFYYQKLNMFKCFKYFYFSKFEIIKNDVFTLFKYIGSVGELFG